MGTPERLLHKAKRSTTTLIPILGALTRQQLEITLGAFRLPLSDSQAARLDAASAIVLGEPYDAIKGASSLIAGGQPELLRSSTVSVRYEVWRILKNHQYGGFLFSNS